MAVHELAELLKHAQPELQSGTYVFVTLPNWPDIPLANILMSFRESEGLSLILEQSVADQYELSYEYLAAWITMKVNSALEAVGFTAAFATELGKHNISCNVVAAFHHDHLFVAKKDGEKALEVLKKLSGPLR